MAGVFAASQTLASLSQAASLLAILTVPGRPLGTSSSWNPLDKNGTTVLTGSNLVASGDANSAARGTKAHYPLNSNAQGIRQFEVVVGNRGSTDSLYVGVGTGAETLAAPGTTSGQPSVSYRANGGYWANGIQTGPGAAWTTGDVIGIVVDSRSSGGGVRAYKNGAPIGSLSGPPTQPFFAMAGSVGSAGWSLTLVTTGFSFPVSGALEWGAGTPFVENTLDGVSQTATGTTGGTGVDRSFAASQTLAGVSQAAAAAVTVSFAATKALAGVSQAATAVVVGGVDRSFVAAQALDGVSQAALAGVRAALSGAQTLSGVSQSATAVITGARLFAAAQTLDGVSQAAAAMAVLRFAAAQVLDDVAQAAAIEAIAKASAIQALDDASSTATAEISIALQAEQILDGVSQDATATVAETVRAFVAAQVLAGVAQTGTMRHGYTFERNERTYNVQPEARVLAIVGESRAFIVEPESRSFLIVPEQRRIMVPP